jgi:hypothetical protein
LLLELAATAGAGEDDFFSDELLDDVEAAAGVDDEPESEDEEVDEDELESDDDDLGLSELRWVERESLR